MFRSIAGWAMGALPSRARGKAATCGPAEQSISEDENGSDISNDECADIETKDRAVLEASFASVKTESGGFIFSNSNVFLQSQDTGAVEGTFSENRGQEGAVQADCLKKTRIPNIIIDPAVRASLDEDEYNNLLLCHSVSAENANLVSSTNSGLSFLNISQGSFDLDAEEFLDLASSAALGFDWKESSAIPVGLVASDDESELNPLDDPPEGSFLPPLLEQRALLELTEIQATAVKYVVRTSRERTEKLFDTVLARVQVLGYSETEFRQLLRYVRDEAPIIIHISSDPVLGFLAKDTHYRNQFETNTSKGSLDHSARRQWEDRMFDKIYTGASPFDRVKYGVLNLTNDPSGVQSCQGYGDSYLVLRGVRLRTSFASKDSSNQDAMMASCEYYVQILAEFSDQELRDALEVGTGKVASKPSSNYGCYKEIQIHGPVQLNKHVECLVLNSHRRDNAVVRRNAEAFCEKHGCWLSFTDSRWWEERVERKKLRRKSDFSTRELAPDRSVDVASFAEKAFTNRERKRRWFW